MNSDIGSVSFMNFHQHIEEINKTVTKFCHKDKKVALLLSLRYSQIVDLDSLNEIAYMVMQLRNDDITVIFTGLHERILKQMESIPYFNRLLQQD